MNLQVIGALVLGCIVLIGAISDVRSRRLPNLLALATAGIGLTLGYQSLPEGVAWWSPALHGLVALIGGMILFRFRWIGGGDAKYYAALACWLPLGQAIMLISTVTLLGLALLIVWFTARRISGKAGMGKEAAALPYGVAIGAGALASYWMTVGT